MKNDFKEKIKGLENVNKDIKESLLNKIKSFDNEDFSFQFTKMTDIKNGFLNISNSLINLNSITESELKDILSASFSQLFLNETAFKNAISQISNMKSSKFNCFLDDIEIVEDYNQESHNRDVENYENLKKDAEDYLKKSLKNFYGIDNPEEILSSDFLNFDASNTDYFIEELKKFLQSKNDLNDIIGYLRSSKISNADIIDPNIDRDKILRFVSRNMKKTIENFEENRKTYLRCNANLIELNIKTKKVVINKEKFKKDMFVFALLYYLNLEKFDFISIMNDTSFFIIKTGSDENYSFSEDDIEKIYDNITLNLPSFRDDIRSSKIGITLKK